jgi:hypothetical protein
MAKKKANDSTEIVEVVKALDYAESGPAETSEVQPTPDRITTQEQAIELIRASYKVPEGCKIILVTEDKNVFWQENTGSAVNHAQKHNLKLFRIQCQDLVK